MRGVEILAEEREIISRQLAVGRSYRWIGRLLDRDHSVVSREVARNGGRSAYRVIPAQRRADEHRARPKPRLLETNTALHDEVNRGLKKKWSPKQISERLRQDFPEDDTMRVSHETIYESLYLQARGELRTQLKLSLRRGRTRRVSRSRTAVARGKIRDMVNISERPVEAEDRAVPGFWEGDLIIGQGGKSQVATLVERTSRYLMLVRIPYDRTAERVAGLLARKMETLPEFLRNSITWDQGKEMAEHANFTVKTGVDIYFWAVSTGHGDTMLRDQLLEDLDRLPPLQRLAWSTIQFCRYSIKFLLSIQGQVSAFRVILPEQPVGVLVEATLPRRVRVAEVDGQTGADGELGVASHLLALIPGHAVAQELRQRLHFPRQQRGHALGAAVVGNLDEHGESAGPFDEGGDLRFAALADDQISLPETGHRTIVGLGGPLADVDHVWDLSPAQGRPGPRHPPSPALAQSQGELRVQLATRLQIQRLINGLVRHSHLRVVRMILFQSFTDLLRRPLLSQALVDRVMQPGRRHQFLLFRPRLALVITFLGGHRPVTGNAAIAIDLTRDRAMVPSEQFPDKTRRTSPAQFPGDRLPLLRAQRLSPTHQPSPQPTPGKGYRNRVKIC